MAASAKVLPKDVYMQTVSGTIDSYYEVQGGLNNSGHFLFNCLSGGQLNALQASLPTDTTKYQINKAKTLVELVSNTNNDIFCQVYLCVARKKNKGYFVEDPLQATQITSTAKVGYDYQDPYSDPFMNPVFVENFKVLKVKKFTLKPTQTKRMYMRRKKMVNIDEVNLVNLNNNKAYDGVTQYMLLQWRAAPGIYSTGTTVGMPNSSINWVQNFKATYTLMENASREVTYGGKILPYTSVSKVIDNTLVFAPTKDQGST